MLKFLGTGSAFNTTYGNNSAYIKRSKSLLLIDCGETVFSEIQKQKLLDGVENIYVVITHLHSDYVGSLGTLILYCHYVLNIKPVIIYSYNEINDLLEIMDVKKDLMYEHCDLGVAILEGLDICINIFDINHAPGINSTFLAIEDEKEKKLAYYSGDSTEINKIDLNLLNAGGYDYFYQDTSSVDYKGNVHLSFKKLKELARPEVRNKVWCMHLDGNLSKEEIELEGFNVARKE